MQLFFDYRMMSDYGSHLDNLSFFSDKEFFGISDFVQLFLINQQALASRTMILNRHKSFGIELQVYSIISMIGYLYSFCAISWLIIHVELFHKSFFAFFNLIFHLLLVVIVNAHASSHPIWLKLQSHESHVLIFVSIFVLEEYILLASENLWLTNDALTFLKQVLHSRLLMNDRSIGQKCDCLAAVKFEKYMLVGHK